jgi:ApbE superfamily uncharacterized protein (UPF0280 family)
VTKGFGLPLFKKKPQAFTLQIQDINLRINAPVEYFEECRAAALSMWEQVSSYSIRNPQFRSSKRPVEVPDDVPAVIREMADAARAAGVGPVFTLQGALTDHVGRFLGRSVSDLLVTAGGDYFIKSRKRMKLLVHRDAMGEELGVIVDPKSGINGVATTLGRGQLPARSVDGMAVLARSCTLADAAAAAAMAILSRPGALKAALDYVRGIEGVRGAVIIKGQNIGVAGGVEVAA